MGSVPKRATSQQKMQGLYCSLVEFCIDRCDAWQLQDLLQLSGVSLPPALSVANRGRSWQIIIRMQYFVGSRLVFLLSPCLGSLLQLEICTWSSPAISKGDFHLIQPLGLLMLLRGIML